MNEEIQVFDLPSAARVRELISHLTVFVHHSVRCQLWLVHFISDLSNGNCDIGRGDAKDGEISTNLAHNTSFM